MFDVHILGVNGEWIDMPEAPEQDVEEDLVSGTSPVVEEEEVVEKQCMCTRELNPVKCANGVTYPNPCTAKCADQTDCVDPREEAESLQKEEEALKEEEARLAKEEQSRLADEQRLANEEAARAEEEQLAAERKEDMIMAAMAVKKLDTEAEMARVQAEGYQAAADRIQEEARIALEAAAFLTTEAGEAREAAMQLLNSSLNEPNPEYDFERIVKGAKFEFSKAISAPTDLSNFLS